MPFKLYQPPDISKDFEAAILPVPELVNGDIKLGEGFRPVAASSQAHYARSNLMAYVLSMAEVIVIGTAAEAPPMEGGVLKVFAYRLGKARHMRRTNSALNALQ